MKYECKEKGKRVSSGRILDITNAFDIFVWDYRLRGITQWLV